MAKEARSNECRDKEVRVKSFDSFFNELLKRFATLEDRQG